MLRATIGVLLTATFLAGCGSDSPSPAAPSPSPSPSPSPAPAPGAGRLDLTASPTLLLLSGSTVTINGRLTDTAGAGLSGRTVQLSADSGSLGAASAVTDSTGAFTTTLTSSVTTTVRASSSGVDGSLAISAVAPFVVGLDAKYSVVKPGDSVDMVVTVTPMPGFANPPGPSTVSLDCGNGDTISLGSQRTASCTYKEKNVYTATVTAGTSNGFKTTASTRISAEAQAPTITLTSREVSHGPGETEVELIAVGAPDRSVCDWNFGEGTKRTGSCNQSFVYAAADADADGKITATVVVHAPGADPVTAEVTFAPEFI